MNRAVSVRAITRVTISNQSCSNLYTWPPSEGRAIVKSKEGLQGCRRTRARVTQRKSGITSVELNSERKSRCPRCHTDPCNFPRQLSARDEPS